MRWQNVPSTTFASITGYRPLAAITLAFADLALVVLCWRLWRLSQTLPRRTVIPLIVAGWIGASACAILTFAGQSTDMGDYIFRAHMLVHLGRNPMTTPPSAVIAWKEFMYLSWHSEPDSYGPLWQWLSGAMHALVGENLLANFLAYKLLATAAIGVSAWLIFAILARHTPGYAAAGLALWLWNPLVLNEGTMHGHNDLAMIPLVLGAVALLLHSLTRGVGHHSGSLGAVCTDVAGVLLLVAAGLIKATIWVLLPVAAVWLIRRRGLLKGMATVALGLLIGAALTWVAYRPFGGWDLLVFMVQKRGWWPANSWPAALFFALRNGAGWPHSETVRWVIGGAAVIFTGVATVAMLRIRDLCLAAWAVVLAYLLIGCHWFQPWYVTWLIALAALVPNRRVAGYTLICSFFMLLHPIAAQYWISRLALPYGGSHAMIAAATLLVPQILAVYLVATSQRRLRFFI